MADLSRLGARDEIARRLHESMRRLLGDNYQWLKESDVVEICLNADGGVWVDRLGQKMERVGAMTADAAETFIDTIAIIHRRTVNWDCPDLDCELPLTGDRFQAVVPPLTSVPVWSIRRKASKIYTLEEYEAMGIITDHQRYIIESSLDTARNVLVTGGTSSGKTTLLNALIHYL